MSDQVALSLAERTESKLRYAKVHLEELVLHDTSPPSDFAAIDFLRAHHESFLFHLFGAKDAFLLEIDHFYQCGLPVKDINPRKLRDLLKKLNLESPELNKLIELYEDKSSWYARAMDLRNQSTHNQGVPRIIIKGGKDDGQVRLKNSLTYEVTEQHFINDFRFWLTEMDQLIHRLRDSASSRLES